MRSTAPTPTCATGSKSCNSGYVLGIGCNRRVTVHGGAAGVRLRVDQIAASLGAGRKPRRSRAIRWLYRANNTEYSTQTLRGLIHNCWSANQSIAYRHGSSTRGSTRGRSTHGPTTRLFAQFAEGGQ
jgi:hypothetical protein